MRVTCKNGFIMYRPDRASDLSRFSRMFSVSLQPEQDYFTYKTLLDMPRYSIQGSPYANLVATKTYEGRHAYEVFRENGWCYSIVTGLIVLEEAIFNKADLIPTLDFTISKNPLIQPGSIVKAGQRLKSYEGILDFDLQRLLLQNVEVGL